MHIQHCWNGLINVVEERDELLVPMPGLALRNDLASGSVECGEQRRGAVKNVIIRDALYVAQTHRQHELCALERLALALLVPAQ